MNAATDSLFIYNRSISATIECKQTQPACKEHDCQEKEPRIWTARQSKCWFGNKQYVLMAYRHDLAARELISSHRDIFKML